MKSKILCIITTYRRNDKVLRLLNQFDEGLINCTNLIDFHVADDFPNSNLESILCRINFKNIKVSYFRNIRNLGQGANHVQAALRNSNYEYFYFPGDDDIIFPIEFQTLIRYTLNLKPIVSVCEFRQGKNLEFGTFFNGQNRIVSHLDDSIELLTRFGKCSSAIVKNPGHEFLKVLLKNFKGSMYPDKAMGVYSLLTSKTKNLVFVFPSLTITGDGDYGILRYSTRVFVNLPLTVLKVVEYYKQETNSDFRLTINNGRSALWWWWFGIRSTMNSSSDIRYTNRKFIKELFCGFFLALYGQTTGNFQKN